MKPRGPAASVRASLPGPARSRLARAVTGGLSLLAFVALSLLPAACGGRASVPDESLLAAGKVIAGCASAEAPRSFAGDDLYQMIDGAAPRFLDKGFLWAVAGAYDCASGRVAVEIYRMSAPAGARAVFDEQAGAGQAIGVGEASRLASGFLEFVRGSFYVTITGFQPGAQAQSDIAAVARAVESRL